MNFQQLRILRETVRQNFNLTEVANALFTSQSGVSKHILDFEDELGIDLFYRKGKRLLGLTEAGKALVVIAERILSDLHTIKQISQEFSDSTKGSLTIATTHTQARYVLPKIVHLFKEKYPKVHLTLLQASPEEITVLLREGRADFGIATEALDDVLDLVTFPFYSWSHAIVIRKGHPLEKKQSLSLDDLVDYPLITYHEGFTGRKNIDQAFAQASLEPDIIMSALDSDVIKTYVELGLGVGIIASMAYDPLRDSSLTLLDSSPLFHRNITKIAIKKGAFLRDYAHDFISLCSSSLTKENVKIALTTPSITDR
jgi:LysR family cys regulon transcriptional activator